MGNLKRINWRYFLYTNICLYSRTINIHKYFLRYIYLNCVKRQLSNHSYFLNKSNSNGCILSPYIKISTCCIMQLCSLSLLYSHTSISIYIFSILRKINFSLCCIFYNNISASILYIKWRESLNIIKIDNAIICIQTH